MRPALLVLRPEPGASATAAAIRALGLEPVVAPLFTVRAIAWALPEEAPDAVLLTSANAVRQGGPALDALTRYPAYAVGRATEAAARQAGFARIVTGEGDAKAIVGQAAADGVRRLLHLCGRELRAVEHPALSIARRIVYASDAIEALPDAAVRALPGAIALLHSPRAAALFASFVTPGGIRIAAISPAALAAAGPGWRAAMAADAPTDASLLAAAAKLCDQEA